MARPRSAEARSKVLAAATELMAERGVANLTIDEVSGRSGVAKTTIYRHWPERTSLIVDAVNGRFEDVGTPDTGSLRGDLMAFFGGIMRADLSGEVSNIIPCLIEAAGRDRDMAELLERIGARRRRVIETLLERAVARGEIAAPDDLDALVGVIVGPIIYQKLLRQVPVTLEYVAACLDIALPGIHVPVGAGTGRDAKRGSALGAHSLVSATEWDRSGSRCRGNQVRQLRSAEVGGYSPVGPASRPSGQPPPGSRANSHSLWWTTSFLW